MEHLRTLPANLPNIVRELPNTFLCPFPQRPVPHRYARNWYHDSNTFDATLR